MGILEEAGTTDGAAQSTGRARAGELAAFQQLLLRYERQVYRTALNLLGRREDAQDAAQEVFLRLYRCFKRLDPDRELSGWLYRVTINVCRDIARRREPVEPLSGIADAAMDPQIRAALREGLETVRRALSQLGHKQRAALVLRDVEGLSTAEVAQVLGSRQATVRSHISAARLKMRRFLEGRL